MTGRKRTLWGLAAVAVIVAIVEAWALASPESGDTISEIVWQVTDSLPLLPFAFGVLAGHFWFPKGICAKCGSAKPTVPAAVPKFRAIACAHCGTLWDPAWDRCRSCGAPKGAA